APQIFAAEADRLRPAAGSDQDRESIGEKALQLPLVGDGNGFRCLVSRQGLSDGMSGAEIAAEAALPEQRPKMRIAAVQPDGLGISFARLGRAPRLLENLGQVGPERGGGAAPGDAG